MKKNILIIILLIIFSVSSIRVHRQYNKYKDIIAENEAAVTACFDDNTILGEHNEQLIQEIEALEKEKAELEKQVETLKKK